MINKSLLSSIIDKYYLKINESVMWEIKNNSLNIDFMTPTRDVIGKVKCPNFNLIDSKLAIFDTKKLSGLISICSQDISLDLEKHQSKFTKLHISDQDFNLTYALAEPLLISKVGTVNIPEWEVELNLEEKDVLNLTKAKAALGEVDNMLIHTTTSLVGDNVCEFIFGDEEGHNNKISYSVTGKIKELNIRLPFNSEIFRTILHVNKNPNGGKLFISNKGLMKLEFIVDGVESEYFIVRKSDNNF